MGAIELASWRSNDQLQLRGFVGALPRTNILHVYLCWGVLILSALPIFSMVSFSIQQCPKRSEVVLRVYFKNFNSFSDVEADDRKH